MSCPSDFSLAHAGDDAREFHTLKNFRVRDFVLPPDVEEFSKASEMEMVHLFFIVSAGSPCFAAIQ